MRDAKFLQQPMVGPQGLEVGPDIPVDIPEGLKSGPQGPKGILEGP